MSEPAHELLRDNMMHEMLREHGNIAWAALTIYQEWDRIEGEAGEASQVEQDSDAGFYHHISELIRLLEATL